MHVLVLGVTGYLGTHVAGELRTLPGARVLVAGRSLAADVTVDLATARPRDLAAALAEVAPDAVVNCAGATGGDAVTLAEVNARGPAVLCAALREAAPGHAWSIWALPPSTAPPDPACASRSRRPPGPPARTARPSWRARSR
ncbi:NAD-dependent epimerase/dehydratase family protein [Streptomyces sp. SS1-1]|nr:NAD-dependent epimerase/dehydratase family protein [Streptomyces sp. SS1-1]